MSWAGQIERHGRVRWPAGWPGGWVGLLVVALALPARAEDGAVAGEPVAVADNDVATAAEALASASPVDPAELATFRETESRFAARMAELDADTRRFLGLREEEERTKLVAGYDQLIATLSEMEDDNRVLTRERMEAFLRAYPDAEYADHVRFRLADLLFVAAKVEWAEAMREHAVVEARLMDEERWDEIPPEPKVDLRPAMDLYETIIANNAHLPDAEQYEHLDGAYYMLGFCAAEPSSAQRSEERARQAFLDLIRVKPNSDLVDAAHLFLGNIHFDNNQLHAAAAEYKKAFDRGPEGLYYVESLYQLAWTYFKMSGPEETERSMGPAGYDRAMELFTLVLDLSEEELQNTGRESEYAPDALKYMAICFSDIADFSELNAQQVAQRWFATRPDARYEWGIYKALAEVLTQQARFEEAVAVYRFMQDEWPLRPENPDLMWKVATLLASGGNPDYDAAAAAVVQLTERYHDETEWWAANRNNPDALAVARKFIEDSLADVAIDYHLRAQQSSNPDDYRAAAAKYREYLEKFPISDDYYQKQAYLADTLFQAGDYDESLAEYESLIRSREHHAYGDLAVIRAGDGTRLRMEGAAGAAPDDAFDAVALERAQEVLAPRWTVPAAGFVERTGRGAGGIEYPVYGLSEWHQAFLDTNARVVAHRFSAPPEGIEDVRDLRELADTRRPKLIYMMAQLLYVHNRFDEAEPLLRRVISEYRELEEASFAAALHVNMYQFQGDLARVRELAKQYTISPPGPPEIAALKAEEFENLLEGTAFKQAMALIEVDRAAAAESFLQFLDEFPESEYAPVALYNAANSYDVIGRSERAIELFERYVDEYPEREESRRLYFRIAATYEATLELERAVDYYERLIRRFPSDPNAADALYNASFLKIGLGDYEGAARGFERYGTQYPTLPDAEEVFWLASEQWEEVGVFEAMRFYDRYLRAYGLQNPDHALQAKHRQSEALADEGRDRQASAKLDEIERDFRAVIDGGGTVGSNARHYAAAAAFRRIQAEFEDFVGQQLTGNDQRDLALLRDELPVRLDAFQTATTAFVSTYGDFEYSTAALLRVGQAYDDYAALFYELKPPESWPDELKDAFYEIIDTEIMPLADTVQGKAVSRLQLVIDFAAERKRHSPYVTEAAATLNRIDPRSYPAQKAEVQGEVDASTPFEPEPVRVAPPEEAE